MRKQLFTIACFLMAIGTAIAQEKLISVKGATTDAIAKTLKEAINIAKPGDKIYLPGGNNFVLDTLKKKVHIIGTGYNHLIERGTFVTMIKTPVRIEATASGSSFTGLEFVKGIKLIKANNIKFNKVYMNGINGYDNISKTYANHITIIHSYSRNDVHDLRNVNIINSVIYRFYNSRDITAVNTIFNSNNVNYDSVYKNCLFPGKINSYKSHNRLISNCEKYESTTFVGGRNLSFFNIGYDLHIHKDSPLFGKNLGIYNGENPWKEGGQPRTPHIIYNKSTLDVQNNQFNIRVKVLPQKN